MGFNYGHNNASSSKCQVCLSNETKTISSFTDSRKQTWTLYFRYKAVVRAPSVNTTYIVKMPNGLYDGQVITFRLKVKDYSDLIFIAFMDNEFGQTETGITERDLCVHVTFNYNQRPNAIFLSTINKATQNWDGPRVLKDVFDYLNFEMDTDVIILIHELNYTVYINGKLVSVYPRSGRLSLKDVIAMKMHPNFYSVFF